MVSVEVLVSLRDDCIDKIPVVVEKLQAAGMTNIRSLSTVGIIIGSVDEDKIADLYSIEEVADVELSQTTPPIPPDSPVQ